MNAVIESTLSDTRQTIDSGIDRAKFLRRVMREDGWVMTARASDNWQITFTRTVKGRPGAPNIDITVKIADRISLVGLWGNQQSFHDSDVVCVPKPDRVHLFYASVQTAAKFLLEKNSHFFISGSSGSTSSSKHGLAFTGIYALIGKDNVMIGHQSVYVNGRIVCCGSVE